MQVSLFDVDITRCGVFPLYVIPSLINVGLFCFTLIFLPQSRINWTFSLFIFLLAITQFADGMMHISGSVVTATAWQRISFVPWIFIVPVGIMFVLFFGKRQFTGHAWLLPVLFIPAIIFTLLVTAGLASFSMVPDNTWGWLANPLPTGFNFVLYGFISGGTLLFPVLLWYNWFRSKKKSIEGKRLLLLAIGVSIPFAGGMMGEVVFPLFFSANNTPLTGTLMTAFSITSFIAIRKFNMLDYSPRNQWDRIVETLREGILIADNDRKIMYANPALCNMLAYDLNELKGREADALILNNSLHGTKFSAEREFQMASKNGELIWVVTKLSACLDRSGKRIGTIWTITDIDDLKKKGLAVKRSESRLNRAQEIAHFGHWDLNFATGKAVWSAEACRIYGLPPHQDIQSFHAWMSRVHPDDLAFVEAELLRSQENFSDSDFEHRILLDDGTVKHIRSISRYEFDGTSVKPIGIYGVCQDITEIKNARERLTLTTNELETYIYKSSHDLHAPLSSILGLVHLGTKEVQDPLASNYLRMIEGQAKKLEAIRTEFIKAMLIKDANKFDEQVPVKQMIEDIVDSLRPLKGFSRVDIQVRVAYDEPIRSNAYLVKTILHNLAENSIKYQDYARLDPRLSIVVSRDEKNVIITVTDNGIGIDSMLQDKIFDMYFRANETVIGSGLGLYLVKKAVDKLNGQLEFKSIKGSGTKFIVRLPQAG